MSHAMGDPANSTDWFIHDGVRQWGPLREVELRRHLANHTESTLLVRQGNSDWVPADSVRKKLSELAEHGVYFRALGRQDIEGPFTAIRAFEILQRMERTETEARLGRHGAWHPAQRLYVKLAGLAGAAENVHEADPPMATFVDEVPTALVVEEEENVDELPAVTPVTGGSGPQRPPEPFAAAGNAPPSQFRSPSPRPTPPGAATAKRPGKAKPTGPANWVLPAILGGVAGLILLGGAGIYLLGSWLGETDETAEQQATFPISNAVQQTHRIPPSVPPGVLFRPTFQTQAGLVDAGSAFAVRLHRSNDTVILSALHLLGPAGGLASDIPASEVPRRWLSTSLLDCRSGAAIGQVAGRPLSLPGTQPFPTASPVGDVIAFHVDDASSFQPYDLATVEAKPGDPVWLVSEVINSASLVHPAHVLGKEDNWLAYEFVDPQIELRATSGAPVLNADHQVIAINAGGGSEDGRTVGVGTPVSQFLSSLNEALQKDR